MGLEEPRILQVVMLLLLEGESVGRAESSAPVAAIQEKHHTASSLRTYSDAQGGEKKIHSGSLLRQRPSAGLSPASATRPRGQTRSTLNKLAMNKHSVSTAADPPAAPARTINPARAHC